MICPKCGTKYNESNANCPGCGVFIKEAHYQPVKKTRKKGRFFLIFLIILFLLCVTAAGGYYYYLQLVEKKCTEITSTFMDCAIKMDFSELEDEIPDQWKDKADIKTYLATQLDENIDQTGLGHLLNQFGISPDYESFLQELTKHADYTIDDVSVTYNKCIVTLTTSNVSYPQMLEDMKSELSSLFKDVTSGGNWWSRVTGWFSDFLNDDEEEHANEGKDIPDHLSGWIDRLIEDREKNEVTGTIVYGIKDGKWTLISLDEKLFYNLYGFPKTE